MCVLWVHGQTDMPMHMCDLIVPPPLPVVQSQPPASYASPSSTTHASFTLFFIARLHFLLLGHLCLLRLCS